MNSSRDTSVPAASGSTPLADDLARRRRRLDGGFWLIAAVFAITMAFAAAPAPLYVLYQERDGFSSFTITLIFAAYALGVVVSLFTVGHVSDKYGRRRIMIPAVLLNVIAAVVFILWPELLGLLIARFLSGLGIGMLTATATAFLTELHGKSREGHSYRRAEVVATAANIGGLGLGPLIAGMLAEYAPAPLLTPHLVFGVLMLLGALLILIVPETVDARGTVWRYRPQRIVVPRDKLGRYLASTMLAFVGFAMFGLFTSLAPSFIASELQIRSHAVAGAVAFVVFAAAALFQITFSRWPLQRQTNVGLVLLAVGLLTVTLAFVIASFALLLIGGVIAGAGVGITFKAATGTVVAIAPPEARGEALAGLFLVGYSGMAVPVMLLGLALQVMSLIPAVIGFGVIMLVLLGITAVALARTRTSRAAVGGK